jgi:thiosulfate dehydrogenase (quinone) large subunit
MYIDDGISKPGFAPRGFTVVLLILRLGIGGLMFEAGLTKFIDGFSAAGFLSHSTGPFSDFFSGLAAYTNVFDVLVPWAEVLIGAAIILGIFVRFASFWGAVEVLIFYFVVLPPQQGWINDQIIYVLVFITLMFSGAGYFLGLDFFGIGFEKRRHWLRWLLG